MALLTRRRVEPRAAMRRAGELGKRTEYLAFVLGGDMYAVPIGVIAEILKPLPITEVPRAPREISGVMSVRGRLVTVIDLRRKFRLGDVRASSPFVPLGRKARILLIAGEDTDASGLIVDEVVQVFRLADNEIEPANVLGGEQPPYIAGIGRPPGALLILLDLKPILEGPAAVAAPATGGAAPAALPRRGQGG